MEVLNLSWCKSSEHRNNRSTAFHNSFN